MSKVLIFTEIYENSYDKSLLEMLTLMDDLNVDPSALYSFRRDSFTHRIK